MVLHRDIILPSLSTGPMGHSSGVPPGSGQAAAAGMWGANSPCREASHGKECCFLGFAAGRLRGSRGVGMALSPPTFQCVV